MYCVVQQFLYLTNNDSVIVSMPKLRGHSMGVVVMEDLPGNFQCLTTEFTTMHCHF